jgi:Bacteriophage baseplate protein W
MMQDYEAKDAGFLGKGWAFPPTFDRSEQTVVMVAAEQDIKESLYILLSTIPGERVMLPDYGCQVHEHVFDVLGETLFTHIRGLIEHAILYYEPRIILESIDIMRGDQFAERMNTGSPGQIERRLMKLVASQLDGLLYIALEYRIIQTNTRNNLVIPFYLQEGTLIPLAEAV